MNIENVNGKKCIIGENGEVTAVILRNESGFYLDKREGCVEEEEVNNYISDLNKITLHKHS